MNREHGAFVARTGNASRGAALAELADEYIEDARHCLAMLDAGGPIDAPACTNGGATKVSLVVKSPFPVNGGEPHLVRTFTHGVPRE